jgi:hypothetical protein
MSWLVHSFHQPEVPIVLSVVHFEKVFDNLAGLIDIALSDQDLHRSARGYVGRNHADKLILEKSVNPLALQQTLEEIRVDNIPEINDAKFSVPHLFALLQG